MDLFADLMEKLYFCSKNIFCGMKGIEEREVAEIAKFTPVELKEYEDSLKTYRNLKNSLDTAEEKGETKGEAKERVIGTGTEVNPQSWTQHLLFICEEEH